MQLLSKWYIANHQWHSKCIESLHHPTSDSENLSIFVRAPLNSQGKWWYLWDRTLNNQAYVHLMMNRIYIIDPTATNLQLDAGLPHARPRHRSRCFVTSLSKIIYPKHLDLCFAWKKLCFGGVDLQNQRSLGALGNIRKWLPKVKSHLLIISMSNDHHKTQKNFYKIL